MIEPDRYRVTMQRIYSALQGTSGPDTSAVRDARDALRHALEREPEHTSEVALIEYRERALADYEANVLRMGADNDPG